MTWLEFYMALPTPQHSKLYVKGYTEATKYYPGVRVIPRESFFEGLSDSKENQNLFYSAERVGFPCYLFPVLSSNNDCYGFVLKGSDKFTPVWRSNGSPYFLGSEQITEGSIVYLCEGIKDSYILRASGCIAVPMLTSVPSNAMIDVLVKKHTRLVFISDNDIYRIQNQNSFVSKLSVTGTAYILYNISGNKDLGEFFDDLPARQSVLRNVKEMFQAVKSVYGSYK